jgi:hypothetical protein
VRIKNHRRKELQHKPLSSQQHQLQTGAAIAPQAVGGDPLLNFICDLIGLQGEIFFAERGFRFSI